jgi:FKBP-type peptidyl-prolyl cis-trans isomerase 2
MSDLPAIAGGRSLSLHLEVRFQDGFVALSSFDEAPIDCTIGDGTLAPGVEALISGLTAGADETILADGSEVFGPYDPDNLHWMQLAEFPLDLEPAPGQVVAFETPGGHQTSGVIREREGDRVRVDFNHPFAGRPLTLRVKVLSVA